MSAIILYKKLGFTEAGIRKEFYTNPIEDAIIMWREPHTLIPTVNIQRRLIMILTVGSYWLYQIRRDKS